MKPTVELLKTFEILQDLSDPILTRIAEIADQRSVQKGTELFTSGESRNSCFLIVDGHLDVRVESGDASGTVVVLGPNDAAAEAALLEPGIHSATGRAVTDLDIIELDAGSVRAALDDDAPAAMGLFAHIARVMVRRLQYTAARRAGWDLVYRPGSTRTEHDLLGDREVPADARYGVQTLRAVENFPITGIRLAHFPQLIRALAMVKQAAAWEGRDGGLLWVIDTDGPVSLSELKLASPPVFDGMAATSAGVYISTMDGKVVFLKSG